jgi:hypothetical protein
LSECQNQRKFRRIDSYWIKWLIVERRRVHFFRNPIAAFIFTIIASATSFIKSSPSFADEGIAELKTSSGLLVTRAAVGSECGADATFATTCTVLYLNDKFLLADNEVTIARAFPSKANPQLVSIDTATGGNHCCRESYIFDFTVKPPLKFKGYFDSKISRTASGVVFQMGGGEDALGDLLIATYSYKFGSGQLVKIRDAPKYNTAPPAEKKYPSEILADPLMRSPILKIVGNTYFSKFRQSMGVESPFKAFDSNFIVADGCQALNCNGRYAMFILDAANKLAWAIEGTGDADLMSFPKRVSGGY